MGSQYPRWWTSAGRQLHCATLQENSQQKVIQTLIFQKDGRLPESLSGLQKLVKQTIWKSLLLNRFGKLQKYTKLWKIADSFQNLNNNKVSLDIACLCNISLTFSKVKETVRHSQKKRIVTSTEEKQSLTQIQ